MWEIGTSESQRICRCDLLSIGYWECNPTVAITLKVPVGQGAEETEHFKPALRPVTLGGSRQKVKQEFLVSLSLCELPLSNVREKLSCTL